MKSLFFTDFSEEIGSNSSKAATQTSLEKAAENGSKKMKCQITCNKKRCRERAPQFDVMGGLFCSVDGTADKDNHLNRLQGIILQIDV